MVLQREENVLKRLQESQSELADRVNELGRSQYMYKQYGRRESAEITGIPANITQENLEKEIIKIFSEAKVEVHSRQINHFDISACQNWGRK